MEVVEPEAAGAGPLEPALPPGDRRLYNVLRVLDHFFGRARTERALGDVRARLRERIEASVSGRPAGRYVEVERRRDLSVAAFRREYLSKARPVLLEGAAAHWPCTEEWSPQYFAARYGGYGLRLLHGSSDDFGYQGEGEALTLGEVVRDLGRGSSRYARAIPLLHDHPELIGALGDRWLRRMRGRAALGGTYSFFMGGAGSVTHNHAAMGDAFMVHAYGRKRWYLTPPSYNPLVEPPLSRSVFLFTEFNPDRPVYDRFPLHRHVDVYVTEAQAGDVLYLPSFFWHHVRNPTDCIGVSFSFYPLWNLLRLAPAQVLLTVCATNPSFFRAFRDRNDISKIVAATRFGGHVRPPD